MSITTQDSILWPNLTIQEHFKVLGQLLGYDKEYSRTIYEALTERLSLDKGTKI